jgi:hypothetical protein
MTTACKVTWAGFLRSGEFTYSLKDQPGSHDFINTKLTRSDVTFDECYEYAILHLKRGKTDTDHKESRLFSPLPILRFALCQRFADCF